MAPAATMASNTFLSILSPFGFLLRGGAIVVGGCSTGDGTPVVPLRGCTGDGATVGGSGDAMLGFPIIGRSNATSTAPAGPVMVAPRSKRRASPPAIA